MRKPGASSRFTSSRGPTQGEEESDVGVVEYFDSPCCLHRATLLSLVSIMDLSEEPPTTFTPRTQEDKGWLGNQLDAFAHMNALGVDVFEAAVAAISGHKMTPELAALCIATYWRRYQAICQYQESRGAIITLQVRTRWHRWSPRGSAEKKYRREIFSPGCPSGVRSAACPAWMLAGLTAALPPGSTLARVGERHAGRRSSFSVPLLHGRFVSISEPEACFFPLLLRRLHAEEWKHGGYCGSNLRRSQMQHQHSTGSGRWARVMRTT